MRVLLVDDQRLFVESLRVFMNTQAPDLNVVGVAFDGDEALTMAESLKPDLVVMDVRMPGMDGVEASRLFAKRMPQIKILMLTTFDDDSYVFEALQNGAVGYLLKDLDPTDLVEAMRATISGSVQMSPQIAQRLVLNAHPRSLDVPPQVSDSFPTEDAQWRSLSRREREILPLIGRGLDNQEIADELNLALQTVKNHVSTIYEKLDVHSRVHLIRICRTSGWA